MAVVITSAVVACAALSVLAIIAAVNNKSSALTIVASVVCVVSIIVTVCSVILVMRMRRNNRMIRYYSHEYKLTEKDTVMFEELSFAPDNFDNLSSVVGSLRNRIVQLEHLKNQSDYLAQQSQINPHFLYNTLDTIRGKALVSDQEDIADMIERLSRIFRYATSNKSTTATVLDEVKNTTDYVTIQQMRFNNRFTYECDMDQEDWRLMYFNIPKLTIQPIVENAIRHGLEGMVSGGRVTLSAYRTDGYIVIRVSDNGCGMSEERLEEVRNMLSGGEISSSPGNTGIGLANINERIRHIFGPQYGLNIASTQNYGTTIEALMPYIEGRTQ